MKVKKELTEGLLVYQDVNTGDKYVWDGKQYVDYKEWMKQNQQQSQGGGKGSQGEDESGDDQQQSPESGGGSTGDQQEPKGPPQVGDKGDQSIQDKEEQERQKQIEKEAEAAEKAAKDAEKEMGKDGSGEGSEVADEFGDEAKSASQVKKELKDAAKKGDKINPKIIDDLAERVKKIQDAFEDNMTKAKIVAETTNKVDQEKLDKAAQEMKRFRESPIQKFKDSMNKFIAKEVSIGRSPTWKKFNKTYANSPIIKQGKSRGEKGHIPLINVYFDRSGSWDDAKTASGMQAIGTLNKYVQRGDIKIEIYYFSDNVHKSKGAAEAEGGTAGRPIIRHIEATKPDNVIIMTDDDIRDIGQDCTVPGAVWILFKGGESENLVQHLHGKKQTKVIRL